MKKISALIPAFNAAETIAVAVESMLWQAVPENCRYEVVVLDDCSTDGTRGVLEQIAGQKRGDRLRVLHNDRNLGVARSRNRLIEAVDADYIVVMDADDISLPGRVLAEVAALEAGHDLVGTFVYNFGAMHGDRRFVADPRHHTILAMIDQRSFCHPAVAFNRRVAQFGYQFDGAEDYWLLTRLLIAGLAVTTIPVHYLLYRVHESSLSSAADGAKYARLRESVCRIRASYIAGLLEIDDAAAASYSMSIENKIFRRHDADDFARLERLSELVRERLGIAADFRLF